MRYRQHLSRDVLSRGASALRTCSSLVAVSVLFACAAPSYTPGQPTSILSAQPTAPGAQPQAETLPAAGQGAALKVALLAPETGPEAVAGAALVNAAQLAMTAPNSPTLDVRDTQSTPEGAAAAAQAALAAGDQLIIGPLSSRETAAVSPLARAANVPVFAFTNDPGQAAAGVWPLGISPGAQFRRLVLAAKGDSRTHLAALLPQTPYGDLAATAVSQAAIEAGFPTPTIVRYSSNFGDMNQTVRDLADYADRRGPLDAKIQLARAKRDAEGRKEAADLASQTIPPPPFDVLVVAASGKELSELESLLPFYDLTPAQVRFLGPNSWAYTSGFGTSAIAGGWYAAPDPALRAQFAQGYMDKFMVQPPSIADVAYDAANLARVLASQGPSLGNITNPAGFAGVDGVFALQPDGTVKRGLAIFQLETGGAPQMVQPSPQNLAAPGN